MRVLKLFIKWLLYITAGLLLLATLFLVVPGLDFSWRSHEEDPPLLALTREKFGGLDIRQVRVGAWQVGLVLSASPFPTPAPRGGQWQGGTFVYMGDTWIFTAGEVPPGWFQ